MQRTEGPQTAFEVYCYNCKSSFAVGTRNCVHCGRPIGGRAGRAGRAAQAAQPGQAGQPGRLGAEPRPEPLEAMDPETAEPSIARRIGGTSLWVIIAIAAAASRLCADG